MSTINIISSGDPEQDAKELTAAKVRQEFIEDNICANGCGPMDTIDNYNRSCPVCGFVVSRVPVYVGGKV